MFWTTLLGTKAPVPFTAGALCPSTCKAMRFSDCPAKVPPAVTVNWSFADLTTLN